MVAVGPGAAKTIHRGGNSRASRARQNVRKIAGTSMNQFSQCQFVKTIDLSRHR